MIVQEGSLLIDVLQMHSVQSLSHVRLFVTPWIAARQAFLSITNSRSSHRLTSIESEMPPSHLILGRPLFLLPPVPPSIRVFSNESTFRIRWPKYWSGLPCPPPGDLPHPGDWITVSSLLHWQVSSLPLRGHQTCIAILLSKMVTKTVSII